jgi:hypothetical protein
MAVDRCGAAGRPIAMKIPVHWINEALTNIEGSTTS